MRFVRNLKLVQFCLFVIIENLERFIYSRCVPQRHIDFLLRMYSKELFKSFSRTKYVSEDCMLWFLNHHCKKIALQTVTEKVIKQLRIIGPTITSLDLRKSFAKENTINSIIPCVPNVTHLDLSITGCSDSTLLCIQRFCPALVSLELFKCKQITNDGVANFCTNNNLKNINLIGTRIEDFALCAILNEMPQLECLKYDNFGEMFYTMKRLSNLQHTKYNLNELIYERDSYLFDSVKIIHAWTVLCPNVRKVRIGFAVQEEALRMCSQFQYLEDLEIDCKRYDPDHSDEDRGFFNGPSSTPEDNLARNILETLISMASKLVVLKLTDAIISTKILIEKFHNLKILGLRNVAFTEFTEEDIVLSENNLETLVVENAAVDDDSSCKAIYLLLSLSKKVRNLHLTVFPNVPQYMLDDMISSMNELSVVDLNNTIASIPSALTFAEVSSKATTYSEECWTNSSFENRCSKVLKLLMPGNTFAWRCTEYSNDVSEEPFFYNPF